MRAAGFREEAGCRGQRPVEHGFGAVGDVDAPRLAVQDGAGEVCDGDDAVGRAEVDGDDDARRRVERDARRWAASGRDVVAGGRDQAGGSEAVDAHRDRRSGQPGEFGELGARARDAVAQDRQQRRGVGRDERLRHARCRS